MKTSLISIIGRPNAGKSTLLNQVIGQKLSIVTPKVQTTRSAIKGILTDEYSQLIFVDTPGIFNPSKKLEKAMVRCAWSSIVGADIICIIIDLSNPRNFDDEFKKILKHISSASAEKVILFNKIDKLGLDSEKLSTIDRCHSREGGNPDKNDEVNSDLIRDPEKIRLDSCLRTNDIDLALSSEITLYSNDIDQILSGAISPEFLAELSCIKDLFKDSKIFFISALQNTNISHLLSYLREISPEGPFLYDKDEITTAPMKFLCNEITREQLFMNLSEELPYNLTVDTEKWEQVSKNEVKIYQTIIVNKDTHKMIVLGKNGIKIKKIGTKAREEIRNCFGLKVHLFLFVKVREDWDNDPTYYTNMGLEVPRNSHK